MANFLTEVDGFTPVIDVLAQDKNIGLVGATIYGAVWRFCQMKDGVCRASLSHIADRIGLERKTVERHIKKLCEAGYLRDLTPDLRNAPHMYADAGRVKILGRVAAEVEGKTLSSTDEPRSDLESHRSDLESDPGKTLSPMKIHERQSIKREDSAPTIPDVSSDPETVAWIADLEATIPPVQNPPHSADEYKAQLLATEGRMLDRLRGEAWLLWGADCRELDAYDGQGQTMRRLGYELERGFGLKPAWSNRKAVKEWLRGMTDCLEASEGQVKPVLDAARKLLNDGLTVSGPYSLIKTTRALAAKHILKVSGTPKVLKVKP